MSRVRNADQFLLRLRSSRGDYRRRYAPLVGELKALLGKNPSGKPQPDAEQLLEFHGRVYLVNAILEALNWRLGCDPEDGLPNLIPEAPVRSLSAERTRFLDYLGYERDTRKPMLVVETKRPGDHLPSRAQRSIGKDSARTVDPVPLMLADGLRGNRLTGAWNNWLNALRDYVRSVSSQARSPVRRVVVTNGDWLVLFADPVDAFLFGDSPDASKILVWYDWKDLERGAAQVFEWLEYSRVAGERPPLSPQELPLHVDPGSLDSLMHGLWVLYTDEEGFFESSYVVKLLPVVFVRSIHNSWLRVQKLQEHYVRRLPRGGDRLSDHLEQVRVDAEDLLREVTQSLGRTLVLRSLREHYQHPDSFSAQRGVTEIQHRSNDRAMHYLVVTGTQTHYVLNRLWDTPCPYRGGCTSSFGRPAARASEPIGMPGEFRSVLAHDDPRRCGHMGVARAKTSAIGSDNLGRCGPRSGEIGQAFCEIARFEECLCCRVCAFLEVCLGAPAFQLPCL